MFGWYWYMRTAFHALIAFVFGRCTIMIFLIQGRRHDPGNRRLQ